MYAIAAVDDFAIAAPLVLSIPQKTIQQERHMGRNGKSICTASSENKPTSQGF
jgi:hypothetical protein